MIGGATGTPSRKLTGPGTPDAGAVDLRRRCPSARSLPTSSSATAEDGVRALPHVDRLAGVREHLQLGVGDGDVDRGGADVDAEEPQLRGQPDDGGAAAAAGGGQPAGLDQPELREPVQLDGELGPGELDRVAELGPGDGAHVAQQGEEERLMAVLRPDRHPSHGRGR